MQYGINVRTCELMQAKDPSQFMTIPDILSGNPAAVHGNMVRTIGLLQQYNVRDSQIWIKDIKSSLELAVDSSVIEPFPFKQNAVYQFIGELNGRSGGIVLRAHVYRCVDSLDLDVYLQAHTLRFREQTK